MHLQRLDDAAARQAIVKPIELTKSTMTFAETTTKQIIEMSDGYPYFIQFICKEVFDAWIGKITVGEAPSVPMNEILQKLDLDFFAPRWARAAPPFRPPLRAYSFPSLAGVFSSISPVAIRMTWTALPMTSAGRFWPWGPLGIGIVWQAKGLSGRKK
ncbi:MAG: hypothetical protein WCE20_19210 [Rhizomicrobium sp.]